MATNEELRAQALNLLVKGDTAGAIDDLRAYLTAEPDDGGAWLALGTAYATIDHLIQGAEALRVAVDLDGEDVEARLAYARVLARIKKPDDAAFQLLQAARLDPPDARVLRELGVVFYEKKLYDKAATWLGKAIAIAPEDARTHYALGLAHEARRDVGAALAAYREAVRLDPSLIDARLTLADALAGMGEHDAAIRELDAVLSAGPTPGLQAALEKAAHNREVLAGALAGMQKQRLLGKGVKELEASAMVREGAFRNKGETQGSDGTPGRTVRYTAPLVELYVTFDAVDAGVLRSLMLVLTDPDRAARAEDDTFKVTIVAEDGHRTPASFATAITLTFLREALGCPMTEASRLYARLTSGTTEAESAGARVAFDSVPRPDKPAEHRHGLRVSLKA